MIKKRKVVRDYIPREYISYGTEVYYDVIPEDKKGHQINKWRKGFKRKTDAEKYGEKVVHNGLATRSRLVTMTESGVYLGDSYYPY